MVTAAAPAPSRRFHYPSEFFVTLFALIATVLFVHAMYVAWIRPTGDAIIAAEQQRMHTDPNYVPERSFFLIIDAPEQEAEIIHFLWAMLIIGYKALLVRRDRKMLDRDLIHVPEGIKVLPEDSSCALCNARSTASPRRAASATRLRRRARSATPRPTGSTRDSR
jgi:hypothetical protein